MNCTAVKDTFVKTLTEAAQTSYCEMLLKREPDESTSVDVANVFLSFAYSDNFMDVIRSLKYFLESKHAHEQISIFVWISMFSVDQNKAAFLPMDWWSGTFKRSIGDIGHVVLVALPWKNPTTLTRGWCLWRYSATIDE